MKSTSLRERVSAALRALRGQYVQQSIPSAAAHTIAHVVSSALHTHHPLRIIAESYFIRTAAEIDWYGVEQSFDHPAAQQMRDAQHAIAAAYIRTGGVLLHTDAAGNLVVVDWSHVSVVADWSQSNFADNSASVSCLV